RSTAEMREVHDNNRIDVFLDDEVEPLASYSPPLRFELDTAALSDGPHVLRVEAYDSFGTKGVKTMRFTVRNGPGIAVSGLHDDDVLHGSVPILVNSYGGAVENRWEPSRAETPSPVPTWGWVLVIMFVAFGLYYGIQNWSPPAGGYAFSSSNSGAAAAGAVPGSQAGTANGPAAPDESAAPTFDHELGASVYGSFCSACHQANGQGMPGVFPPIAGDPVVTADDPTEHIDIVLGGLLGKEIGGVDYASPMPAFGQQLGDDQIAAVINYQRTSFGNRAPLITAEDVAAQR
ncbi:MAG TPA: cytochrome c, partial [Trueperaceae bacterium]|nr:cytochrome c [Trueperaceae bacterium]